MTEKRQRGVSKAQWLETGLETLTIGSVDKLTVEGLARSLGINKAGFYWHFKNRDDFLHDLLGYWVHELTEVVTDNEQLRALDPKTRLAKTAEMILDYRLERYDMAIRQWAKTDPSAARAVRKVNGFRLGFVREALSELGFSGSDLEMRSMLFVCYHTWESSMFPEISNKKRRELIADRTELIARK